MTLPTDMAKAYDDVLEQIEAEHAEIVSWKPGHVLSDGDVARLHRYLAVDKDEIEGSTKLYQYAREEAFHEIGGEELVQFMRQLDALESREVIASVLMRFYKRRAEQESARKQKQN